MKSAAKVHRDLFDISLRSLRQFSSSGISSRVGRCHKCFLATGHRALSPVPSPSLFIPLSLSLSLTLSLLPRLLYFLLYSFDSDCSFFLSFFLSLYCSAVWILLSCSSVFLCCVLSSSLHSLSLSLSPSLHLSCPLPLLSRMPHTWESISFSDSFSSLSLSLSLSC